MTTVLMQCLSTIWLKVLQCGGGGGGGGGGGVGTISFQLAADGVQPSRPQTFHFQARASYFNHIHATEPEHWPGYNLGICAIVKIFKRELLVEN